MGGRTLRIAGRVGVWFAAILAVAFCGGIINHLTGSTFGSHMAGWMNCLAFLWIFPSMRPWKP